MHKLENKSILIVEDDDALRLSLKNYFSKANDVDCAESLSVARKLVESRGYDIVLLDLILPDGSGIKLFESFTEYVPVVILSDLGTEENIICGLESGAADYIVKPASPELAEARMFLRLLPPKDAVISSHGLTLDSVRRTAAFRGQKLDLTSSEFNILHYLMRNPGVYFTANDVYTAVWKLPHLNTSTVKMHIHNMRKKMLSVSEDCGHLIVNQFGKGYAFILDDEN